VTAAAAAVAACVQRLASVFLQEVTVTQ
jgi:hypothetical protein